MPTKKIKTKAKPKIKSKAKPSTKSGKTKHIGGHKIKISYELTDFGVPLYRSKNKNIKEAMTEIKQYLDKKCGSKK